MLGPGDHEGPQGGPGDLPNPRTEPMSPALQVDSLPSESLGRPQIPLLLSIVDGIAKSQTQLSD